jgi:hypothetical protein
MRLKVITFLVFVLLLLAGCKSGRNDESLVDPSAKEDKETTEIVFNEYEYDFGKIKEGEKVAHIFAFQNKGPGKLVISSASTSCGCTVPKFDKNPISAGKGGTLEVVFNSSGRSGIQTKTITVRSNAKTKVVVLKIIAEVLPDER